MKEVSGLSAAYQRILYWHAIEGLSDAAIGKKLRISENAVKMRIFRARVALKKMCKNI